MVVISILATIAIASILLGIIVGRIQLQLSFRRSHINGPPIPNSVVAALIGFLCWILLAFIPGFMPTGVSQWTFEWMKLLGAAIGTAGTLLGAGLALSSFGKEAPAKPKGKKK